MVYEALVVVVVGKVFYTTDDYSAKNEEAFHGLQTIPSSITGSLLAG
jgi:hypothetical protein